VSVDFVLGWLKIIGGLAPPFSVEVVLRDGSRYFLHSVFMVDEETSTFLLRVWDLRAFGEVDIEALKVKLNAMRDRDALQKEHEIHPKLDWANLRVPFNEIAYCVEWYDRLWPEELRPKQIGFASRES
jgi:hypothetical protein